MFEAHVEANMPDDEIAEYLSEDSGWLQAQWPECTRQAEEANHTVTGDPVFKNFTYKGAAPDAGRLYDFVFDVPTT